jgi:hypothetical protein
MTHVQTRLGLKGSSLGFVFTISVAALLVAAVMFVGGLVRLFEADAGRDGGGTLSFLGRQF